MFLGVAAMFAVVPRLRRTMGVEDGRPLERAVRLAASAALAVFDIVAPPRRNVLSAIRFLAAAIGISALELNSLLNTWPRVSPEEAVALGGVFLVGSTSIALLTFGMVRACQSAIRRSMNARPRNAFRVLIAVAVLVSLAGASAVALLFFQNFFTVFEGGRGAEDVQAVWEYARESTASALAEWIAGTPPRNVSGFWSLAFAPVVLAIVTIAACLAGWTLNRPSNPGAAPAVDAI